MHESSFPANPHALITEGVCTDVVYMQSYTLEEIAEVLKGYSYDRVAVWDDLGQAIYIDWIQQEDADGVYYTSPQPFPSWIWDKNTCVWVSPVEHPWTIEARENPTFTRSATNTSWMWDEELKDWTPNSVDCCA
jgi:hypothetical protein